MFPSRVGRLILDGTEYVRDHRELGGFGWTALDNSTDAWNNGFLGECVNAGPSRCALARSDTTSLAALQERMESLLSSVLTRPVPGVLPNSGPAVMTYSTLVAMLYSSMYRPASWPATASMLAELERGNATLALRMADSSAFEFDPSRPVPAGVPHRPSSDESGMLVICADQYDAPQQPLEWYGDLWQNMTTR